jgi:hypothetical protein
LPKDNKKNGNNLPKGNVKKKNQDFCQIENFQKVKSLA